MSKKTFNQVRQLLILGILLALCVALVTVIFRDYKIYDENAIKSEPKQLFQKDLNSKNQSEFKSKQILNFKTQKITEEKTKEISVLNIENSKNIKEIKKPKLAIIMDDIATIEHAREIIKLDLKITPSIFPASKMHPNTPNLAAEFDFFMLHLPLEALNFKNNEPNTLKINDKSEKIAQILSQIKRDFPRLKYINNHTGSAFTSNENAMRRLFVEFEKLDFVFVDSFTIKNSFGQKMASEFKKPFIKRDIFLDNENEINYIKNQISKAVKIAEKNGFAIAICHPKSATFKALKESRIELEKVELVYLSEIYE